MRLDRYLPEQRRRRSGPGRQKFAIFGLVLGVHLLAGAGLVAWTTIRERNAPPRMVIRYFDITVMPTANTAGAIAEATTPRP